jgi:hypothetical protein
MMQGRYFLATRSSAERGVLAEADVPHAIMTRYIVTGRESTS